MRRSKAIIGFAASTVAFFLLTATHARSEEPTTTIDTQCNDRGCRTYIGQAAPGITVIPPVPPDAIVVCAGSRCRFEPMPERPPAERRR